MTRSTVRVGVGSRFQYDGEIVTVEEMTSTTSGINLLVKDGRGRRMWLSLRELLTSEHAKVIPETDGPNADDALEPADVVLSQLTESELARIRERAAHVREVLTGYKSGSDVLVSEGEPRPQYAPNVLLTERYSAKAQELGVTDRTLRRWVRAFKAHGEAGLVAAGNETSPRRPWGRTDERWVEVALEVMVEHTGESRPSRSMVIERANARVVARFGEEAVSLPSRATAFRVLEELEKKHPTFRLSTKRNRDIADRPDTAYGKLRPTRPGEYLLMDTTRLDVFALDPVTLRWMQAELTVAMDWYTRCITGIRITPVSTKAVDVSSVLYQCYRPRPAAPGWPEHAVWPEHGVPRSVLVDTAAVESPGEGRTGAAGPAVVPETIVVDHGKVYVSEHVTSVCRRMGISIQPARLRTGRDKGRWSGFSAPCGKTCCRHCPVTRARMFIPAVWTRNRRRSSSSTSWKPSSGSGRRWSITTGRTLVSSIRTCRSCRCHLR